MYRDILVPIDGSETARRGQREAIALAASQKAQKARLHFLHVVETMPPYLGYAPAAAIDQGVELIRQRGEALVAAACHEANASGVDAEGAVRELTEGRVAHRIVAEAERCGAELIVMGTHARHGIARLALGSNAELVARSAPVSLLLVRG
jgi:nucleotide-binding universal stress UspA family protein